MEIGCVVVVGFGSRGDVLPLIVTIEKLLHLGIPRILKIHLVTNEIHSHICSYLLQQYSDQLHLHFIDKGVLIHDSKCNRTSNVCFYDNTYIIEILQLLFVERNVKISLVISNLFALESWIVSVAFQSRCLIIHPTPPFTESGQHHSVKENALTSLKTIRPQLYSSSSSIGGDSISWEDYALWLWPLLVDSDENRETIRKIFSIAQAHGFHPAAAAAVGSGGWSRGFMGGTTTGSSDDDDPIRMLIQSASESPTVLIAMSPTLMEPTASDGHRDGYLDTVLLRSCIGQVIDTAGLFLDLPPPEEGHCDGGSGGGVVVSVHNGNLVETLEDLRIMEDTGHHGAVLIDFGSLTEWIVDTFHLHTLIGALFLLSHAYRFVFVTHRQHVRIHQVCEEVSKEIPVVVSAPIILVAGDVHHSAVLHRFVSVISHGGVGVVSTCLRIGIPQVIIPLMYDQQKWATRVKQLRIGPGPLDREVLLPVLGQANTQGPGIIFEAAYNALRDALQESTTPQCRLRAGTLGRKHRDNMEKEDGNSNVFRIVSNEIENIFSPKKEKKLISTDFESNEATEDAQEAVFPGGLTVFCHHESAPEETAFLFDEIFYKQVYTNHGILLNTGDVILDIGANVGFFSIFAELQFGGCCNALQIIAVEPVGRNFNKLVKNLKKYAPTAICVRAAVGDPDPTLYEVEQGKYSTTMCFDRRCPGNACCERYFRRNRRQRALFMNPAITGPRGRGSGDDNDCFASHVGGGVDNNELVERCPVMTLSEIIETAWAMGSESSGQPASIALLKLDVEGAEWEALRGLRDERYWSSILQIVLETAQCVCRRCRSETVEIATTTTTTTVLMEQDDSDDDHDDNIADIQQLLIERGFKVIVDYNPWGWSTVTGNVMVYARRTAIS